MFSLMLVVQLVFSNTITYVNHTPSYGIEILLHWFEVATTMSFDSMHEYPEPAVAKLFKCSISNADTMGPLLNCDNVRIWFNDFAYCRKNMQVPFDMVLEQYCQARMPTFERLLLLLMYWTEKQFNFNVYNEDLSWTNNIQSIIFMCIVGTW